MVSVLNISELLEHAEMHKVAYGDSFITFLSKHYGAQSEEHQKDPGHDGKAHESLPLATGTPVFTVFTPAFVCVDVLSPTVSPDDHRALINARYVGLQSRQLAIDLFQPPRCS